MQWLGMTSWLPRFSRVTDKEIPKKYQLTLVSTVAVVVEVRVSTATAYMTQ